MSVILYLLPLGLVFDFAGYLPPALRIFLLAGLLALPLCLWPSRQAAWLGAGLGLLLALRATFPPPEVADTALFLLAHQTIWAVIARVPRRLQTGVAVYACVHLLLFLSPLGYPVLEWLAAAGNRAAQWLTGFPSHFGYTWQNTGAILLFLVLSIFTLDKSRVAAWRTVSFVVVAVLINAFAIALVLDRADFGADFAWKLEFRDRFTLHELSVRLWSLRLLWVPALAFLAYLGAFVVLHFDLARPGTGNPAAAGGQAQAPGWGTPGGDGRIGRHAAVVGGLAVALVLVATPPTAWPRPKPVELVFLNKGVVSFTKPDDTRYGKGAGGMFGMLTDYPQLFGCRTSVVDEIPESLEPGQVLVVTNLDVPVDDASRQRVWDFVERGGALWVLGDHTFVKNGRNHINDLLAPVSIALNNDSAQFFPQGWFHAYRFRQGTPFGRLRDDAENRPGILVGASLELAAPSEPFIVGRFAYGDRGRDEADADRGYLGDFVYQPGERLGDLVLVAGQYYGKGRVLVFGDTSSFFNNTMPRSYELLRANLSWLGGSPSGALPASLAGRTLAAVLLLGLGAAAWIRRSEPVATGALAAMVLSSVLLHGASGQLPYDPGYSREHLAVIDFSHQPNASKHGSMDAGLHGVSINCMRHGLLPVAVNEWDPALLDRARYVFMNAPRQPVTSGERRDLTRFMERGGTLVVACGYQDAASCRRLLEPLGLRVGNVPLGRFFDRPAFGQPVSFMSAWPIEVDNGRAEILCEHESGALIVSVPVGDGELVLIGDSEFLHNRNLEGSENHDPANTAFLKHLFDHTSR